MKSKTRNIYLVLFGIALLTSCEKLLIEQNKNNTPVENFNFLWNELNRGYVYFDYKMVEWDSIKTVYEPQVNNSTTEDELFDVLANMLETLKDGHVSIRQNFLNQRSYDITQGFLPNFNKVFVIENYLIPNDMDTTTWIRHCFLTEDIGYMYYSTFTNEIAEKGMDEILLKYKNTKGLIIDVRGNFGGDATNIEKLMAHFVSDDKLVGYSQKKTGEGYDDLTQPKANIISPSGIAYTKPIIILSNRQCYSACNAFISYMSLLPNVTILGDRSGGGAGLPVSGQLPNGWVFSYSSTIGYLPDGFIYENGIDPDIFINTNESYELQGLDNIIEQAILQLD